MEKTLKGFFKPISKNFDPSSLSSFESEASTVAQKRTRIEFNPNDIIVDPGKRKPIEEYDTAIRDQVRREYLLKGPCQLYGRDYPRKKQGDSMRSFKEAWYLKFPWLEYSAEKDAAYCLYCYLFAKPGKRSEIFTSTGFSNWKKAIELFNQHVGGVNSVHNDARCNCEDFQNQQQSISHAMTSQSRELEIVDRTHLTAALHVVRFLLKQGLAFCGHNESSSSSNRGNFLELFTWYTNRVESVRNVIIDNVPGNNQLASPQIQKDLVNACASQTTSAIIMELGDNYFSILIDESRDKSIKEQMALILRFVNKSGEVIERFFAIEHVSDTSSCSLKAALDGLFARHGLSISRLRGQAYAGASNMREEFNGLKALIQVENPFAFYVHCFAHQLHVVIISVVKSIPVVCDFFTYTSMIVNVVGASCKRRDALTQKHHENILQKLKTDEIFTGRGKHQETNVTRPGDTRWGSHYVTLIHLKSMWDSVLWVLEKVCEDGTILEQKGTASSLIEKMESFHFVFILHLMLKVLGITNDLSNALQQRDQNIVNAMNLIDTLKEVLQALREDGWIVLFEEVTTFCDKMHIPVPDMKDHLPVRGCSRRGGQLITYYHHYHNEIFLTVIDLLIVEMNNRFSETSTALLRCISCLDPRNSFAKFNHASLISLAEMYSDDFSFTDLYILKDQLHTYIHDVRRSADFAGCYDLADLAVKMVQTDRHLVFPLVYRLIELVLILPVVTASVERAFSAMNVIETDLCNRMGDEWMNDIVVCYIERELFDSIDDEDILQHFQNARNRQIKLPRLSRSSN